MATVEETKKNYTVISVAADLTGSRMIDEVFNLAAWASPEKSFRQFVMPFGEVSRETAKLFGIRVHTFLGKYRDLWDMRGKSILSSKSSYSTLVSFMEWMKKVKEDAGSDGIILLHYENNLNIVPFIMDIVDNYKLTVDFFGIVKGFASVNELAFKLCGLPKTSSLRELLKPLDDESTKVYPLDRAQKRARLTYRAAANLLKLEKNVAISYDAVLPFVTGQDQELVNLANMKARILKVKTLRPIFEAEMEKGPKQRNRAILLREYLVSIEADYGLLETTYKSEAGEGLQKLFGQVENPKDKQNIEDLVKMLLVHFGGGNVAEAEKDAAAANIENEIKTEIGAGDAGLPRTKYYHRRRRANSKKQIKDDATNSTPLSPQN